MSLTKGNKLNIYPFSSLYHSIKMNRYKCASRFRNSKVATSEI